MSKVRIELLLYNYNEYIDNCIYLVFAAIKKPIYN